MNSQINPTKTALVALIVSTVLAVIYFYLRISGIIPRPDGVFNWLENLYAHYGYWVVFGAALLEGIVIINMYVPGSNAILLGVIFAKRSGLSVPAVVALVVLGFTISLSLNYLIGRHGVYRLLRRFGLDKKLTEEGKVLVHNNMWSMFASFIHPNIASLMSIGAGIVAMPYRRFLTITMLSLLFWDSFWAIVTYTLGDTLLRFMESPYALFAAAGWTGIVVLVPYIQYRLGKRTSTV